MKTVNPPWAQSDSRPDLVFADSVGMIDQTRPVAKFLNPADARTAVKAVNAAEDHARLLRAMQWLLDTLNDAGESHDEKGQIYDSVEYAAASLVSLSGNLNWYGQDDAYAYLEREARREWLEREVDRTAHLPSNAPERKLIEERAHRWGLELPR
ncbi:hypothetical protein [Aquabacter cavernae]|uniref:hypothetical protein n=1 Tax=Aquabacter cavernae TaxID=2496029 RepID=UPI000F8C5E6A|nr:hypothetical protein [Aquabacter cavernae]